jgi:hypothetical protein
MRAEAASGRHAQRIATAAVHVILEVDDADVGSVLSSTIAAPAPSPKITHVVRSV